MVSKQHVIFKVSPIFCGMPNIFNHKGLQRIHCKARVKILRKFISKNELLQINVNVPA